MRNLTIVFIVIFAALLLSACAFVADEQGVKIADPEALARATHIAQMSEQSVRATEQAVSIEATRQTADIIARATESSIENSKRQAEADKLKAGAAIETGSVGAATAGKSTLFLLGYSGAGVGLMILLVGAAFGLSAWIAKQTSTIYPDARGQFPVIVRKGAGFIAYHDPNRALGPGAVLRTPGLIERVAYSLALAQGKVERLEPGTEYHQPGSEGTMLQIAAQEQAAQVVIAERSGRPKLLVAMMGGPGNDAPEQKPARSRMPPVTLINDPAQIERFEQKLLECEGDQ